MSPEGKRIGFVSTRLAGTDGVSLEVRKWAGVLERLGHDCFFFAGEIDWPEDRSYFVLEAHFNHPDILALTRDLFDDYKRTQETSAEVSRLKDHLKAHLYRFHQQFDLDLLIVENALAIPMNIPLGLALTEWIAETSLPVIAHHHDFAWERERFLVSAAQDYLRAAFPPTLPSLHHVVINSVASHELARRTGVNSMLIPNVMDFDAPPSTITDNGLRRALDIPDDTYLLLQPTRVVPRKRIEHAIYLAQRLREPCTLVITHSAGDEGHAYMQFLRDYAEALNVRLIQADHLVGEDGDKPYSLGAAYQAADLVTYPSELEGFGNAFLETIYFKRPIVLHAYEIFRADIAPKGFDVVAFEGFITSDTVQRARELLHHPAHIKAIVEQNYELGRRYYSYTVLETLLSALMQDALGR